MSVKDWADRSHKPVNAFGSKGKVGESKNSYSDWRRTVGHGCYANDVDWIEWRRMAGAVCPVAVIETTFYDDKPELRHLLPSYTSAALDRFKRDGQYEVTKLVAARLGVQAYFVVARKDLAVFFACRLSDERWLQMDEPAYKQWLIRLRPRPV